VKTIPAHVIDEVWQSLSEATPEQSQALAARMQQEQPFIMVYLLAAEENLLDPDERGSLLMLGAIIWQVISSVRAPLRQASDADLEAAEEANIRALEQLDEASEMDYTEAVSRLISSYNQMPLLGAVLEALMSGHEEAPELAPEHIGMALIHLKTVIDCLDQ
jgi:hypothetical protein